jgi:hypothetical protein
MAAYVLGQTVAHVVEWDARGVWRPDGKRERQRAWWPLCHHIARPLPDGGPLHHAWGPHDQPELPWCKRCRAILWYRVVAVFPELAR